MIARRTVMCHPAVIKQMKHTGMLQIVSLNSSREMNKRYKPESKSFCDI